jgi:hypothetical protein
MGIQEILTMTAGAIEVLAPLPYIVDTIRNRTHPNIVTWLTWTLINIVNLSAAFASGSWQTGVYSLCGVIATGTIVVLGLWHGVRQYTRFDFICQAVALLGFPIWAITNRPELAVLVVLLVDFSGGLPTLRHAWRAPHEETMKTFVLSALAAALLLMGLHQFNFISVTMPLYILSFDCALIFSIWYRRRVLGYNARHD